MEKIRKTRIVPYKTQNLNRITIPNSRRLKEKHVGSTVPIPLEEVIKKDIYNDETLHGYVVTQRWISEEYRNL